MAAVIPILYEDNHLLVVVKPPHIPVQADASGDRDLLTMLKADVKERYHKPGAVYLGLVHRLDRPVGGVMVFARTSKAASRLSAAIREGRMEKRYLCVACGECPGGTLTDWLKKDERTHSSRVTEEGAPGAKLARLTYRTLAVQEGLSLCDVTLLTGRSHQIRVQMAHSGHPLWGDARYNPSAKPGQDIALFCRCLAFPHPVGGREMRFTAGPEGGVWNLFDRACYRALKEEKND